DCRRRRVVRGRRSGDRADRERLRARGGAGGAQPGGASPAVVSKSEGIHVEEPSEPRITFASATLRGAVGSARQGRVSVDGADDHPIYREGLTDAIKRRPDLELVGEAADGRSALDEIRELAPEVAVLDLKMPELSGFEVLHAIQRDGIETRVVVLSAASESED